jgi:hypothetical protein
MLMADERDREHVDRPSSDAVKDEKGASPADAASADKDVTPTKVETDREIEDRFEATDN